MATRIVKKSFWDKAGPAMTVLIVVMSFVLGSMWTKVSYLEKGLPASGTQNSVNAQPQAQPQQPAQVAVTLDQVRGLFDKKVIKFGNSKSKLLFVEFGDPSCPYCHVAAGENPELNTQIGSQFKLVADGGSYVAPVVEMRKLVDSGKAAFAWIYVPGHGNGEMATKALYCAYDEGKFWEVHDVLMTNKGYDFVNNTLKNDITKADELIAFVKSAINSSKFNECIKSTKYDSRLPEETQLGSSFGVQGTPGFLVNAKTFAGAYSFNDMKADVDAAL